MTGAPPVALDAGLIDRLENDVLLRSLLRATVNTDFRLEIVLTALRRTLVLERPVHALPLGLTADLAVQCFLNEYVFSVGDAERERHRAHLSSITAAGDTVSAALLLVYALFAPLHTLPNAAQLAEIPLETWPPAVREVLAKTLHEPRAEQAIKQIIEPLGTVTDRISLAVQEQYESNPYPRWNHLPPQERLTAADYLRRRFPRFVPPDFLDKPIEALIAGCGTGQHTAIAAATYCNARITAIDLSRSSLAYAIRMADQLELPEIRFLHGDLLEVDRLGKHFALIESIGVLHHMRDPTAGWSALSGVLRPGGVFNVGLYSEDARRVIVQARNRIEEMEVPPTAAGIRAFRAAVLDAGATGPLAGLLDTYDFFTTSSCRDLLFHVQEHRYTLPQIADLITSSGLRFIGFDFDDQTIPEKFREQYGPEAMGNLERWGEFDRLNPGLMEGYVFWCQKL